MSEHYNQTGFNDIKQVEMSVLSAEHMVGKATRSMDEEQLEAATNALNDAKAQLHRAMAHQTGVDQAFFEMSQELIAKADHQLKEAKE
ncbi:DUF2564 family protein [Halalkalibacter alkaliphilus]|jgi:hypothetical protein|uniref:DUF2564 family protein n=1 Tax=Halalkalibacter alkaliphilus TaxID=2917993 RepID=A0A9X2CRF6_9BACI|nr:DUF2564 family protein [Halalkalibacter alkaliphilus]MCL7746024.1 DUF2564 family protein [Halalkalibacter alkaliphilus]